MKWIWDGASAPSLFHGGLRRAPHDARCGSAWNSAAAPQSTDQRSGARAWRAALSANSERNGSDAPAHALYDKTRSLLFQIEEAVEAVRSIARGEQGRLAIGVSSSAAFSPIIPGLIRSFRSILPGVTVGLGEDSAEELIQSLRLGNKDIVFTCSVPQNLTGISFVTLVEEPMVAALPSSHALQEKADIGIDLIALRDERFILYRQPGGPGLYEAIIAACQRAGFNPRISDEALRLPSTLNFVAAGLGVSIVPDSLQRLDIEGVVYAPLRGCDDLTAPLNIVYRQVAEGSTRRFIDHARASFEGQETKSEAYNAFTI
jgi:DNA-binding transcriptional LysR family regulator